VSLSVIEVKKALKGFGTLYHLTTVNLLFVIRISGKPIKRLSLLIDIVLWVKKPVEPTRLKILTVF
jgi:hypothetical protein